MMKGIGHLPGEERARLRKARADGRALAEELKKCESAKASDGRDPRDPGFDPAFE